MSDFFDREAALVLGVTPRVTPRLASRYEPGGWTGELDSTGLPDGPRAADPQSSSIPATAPRAVRPPPPDETRQPTRSTGEESEDAAQQPFPTVTSERSDSALASNRSPPRRRADAPAGPDPAEGDRSLVEPTLPTRGATPPEGDPSSGSVSVRDERVVSRHSGSAPPRPESVRGARPPARGDPAAVAAVEERRPSGGDRRAARTIRKPEPDEASIAGATTEPREAQPAAVAGHAPTETDRHSLVEGGGPILVRAPTWPEPDLAEYQIRTESAPELRRLDHDRRGGPSRSVASDAEADRGPIVRVTIGRVEVRATQPAVNAQEAPAASPAWSPSVLSLEEYLEQRKGMWR